MPKKTRIVNISNQPDGEQKLRTNTPPGPVIPVTSNLKLQKTDNTNQIIEQKNFNNENINILDDAVQKAIDKKDQTVYVGDLPPTNDFAKIWIDTSRDYKQNQVAYCSVGPEPPIDPNVALWLDTSS